MNIIPTILRRKYKKWKFSLSLTKRQQFVAATAILSVGLILTQLVSGDYRYQMVIGLSVFAYGISAFTLRDDLRGVEWVTLLMLPTLFTTAIALFYFLLPTRWLTRVPVVAVYAIGMYALLLTENIYNVAANRTIALLRAGHSVGFVLTLITYFSLVQTILAFRLLAPFNMILIGLITFPLVLQSLWSYELEERISSKVWQLTIILSLSIAQLAWIFPFIPVKSTLVVLFLTTFYYSSVGMAQHYLIEKLYKKSIVEFFVVAIVVLFLIIFSARWRGGNL